MSALGRARQPYILKINYCRRPRSLHLKISRDLKLMNFLQQFELHSTSIKFSSGLNQPLRLLLAFSNLAASREVRGRKGLEAGGWGGERLHGGQAGRGAPSPGCQGSVLLGFQIWNQILGHLLEAGKSCQRVRFL